MSLNQLFTSNYFDQLYEILRESDYPDILRICKSDQKINNFCQTSPLIKELLINKQTDMYIKNYGNGRRALIAAVRRGNITVFDRLIKRGENPSRDDDGENILTIASMNGDLPIVDRLLRDPRVNPAMYGNIPIFWASYVGQLQQINVIEQLNLQVIGNICWWLKDY